MTQFCNSGDFDISSSDNYFTAVSDINNGGDPFEVWGRVFGISVSDFTKDSIVPYVKGEVDVLAFCEAIGIHPAYFISENIKSIDSSIIEALLIIDKREGYSSYDKDIAVKFLKEEKYRYCELLDSDPVIADFFETMDQYYDLYYERNDLLVGSDKLEDVRFSFNRHRLQINLSKEISKSFSLASKIYKDNFPKDKANKFDDVGIDGFMYPIEKLSDFVRSLKIKDSIMERSGIKNCGLYNSFNRVLKLYSKLDELNSCDPVYVNLYRNKNMMEDAGFGIPQYENISWHISNSL